MRVPGPQNAETSLKFIKWNDIYKTEKPFQIFANLPDDATDKRLSNLDWEDKSKVVADLRGSESEYSLDANGFQVVQHKSAIDDFRDRELIERGYLPEVEELLRQRLDGVDKVRVVALPLLSCHFR
jgi:hypothetical protein